MVKKKIEQQVTKWWHAFTELKSWVQIVIAGNIGYRQARFIHEGQRL